MDLPFTMRSYASERDLAALCALINANYALDWPDRSVSEEDVRRCLVTAPGVQPQHDLALWTNADEQMVGAAGLRINLPGGRERVGQFAWFIHPMARRQGLEAAIHAWGSTRMAQVARDRGQVARLECATWAGAAYRQAVLDVQGYQTLRYGFKMTRSLIDPLPVPRFPPDYTLRAAAGATDMEEWVALYNDIFGDRTGFRPWTVAEHRHCVSAPYYRVDGDLRARAPDDTLAAICLCWIDPAANLRQGRSEGWIAPLGTRRTDRRRGLGRAMLLSGLQWLRAAGVTSAVLLVDVENPTGALQLDESVGFIQADGLVIYQRVV